MIVHDWQDNPGDLSVLRRAERALIGSFLIAGTIDGIRIAPEDFHHAAASEIYAAMRRMTEAGEPIDTLTVAARLEWDGKHPPDDYSWLTLLSSTLDDIPDVENRKAYARIIRTAAKSRRRAAWAK